jgi:hypothetical protein
LEEPSESLSSEAATTSSTLVYYHHHYNRHLHQKTNQKQKWRARYVDNRKRGRKPEGPRSFQLRKRDNSNLSETKITSYVDIRTLAREISGYSRLLEIEQKTDPNSAMEMIRDA